MIRRTWIQMGMPVTVCIADPSASETDIDAIEELFDAVDARFSTYRPDSEVSRLNAGELEADQVSLELADILAQCEVTKITTGGFFDIERNGAIDPSGLVKGWAIQRGSALLSSRGLRNHLVDAGGDVQVRGLNADGLPWRVGIRNPFDRTQIIKVLSVYDGGVATSGTAIRGEHIYDPFSADSLSTDLVSLTVVGATVYDADRMATAAFAMGRDGIEFIRRQPGLECYAVFRDATAQYTMGFDDYVRYGLRLAGQGAGPDFDVPPGDLLLVRFAGDRFGAGVSR